MDGVDFFPIWSSRFGLLICDKVNMTELTDRVRIESSMVPDTSPPSIWATGYY